MTVGMIIFCVIIFIWCFVGFLGGLHCKENRVNYELLIFMAFVPFIPLIAYACGLR